MKKHEKSAPLIGGVPADELTERFTERTIRIFEDGDQLSHLAEQWKNGDVLKTQGRMFEQLETIKFNLDALKKDSDLFAETTASLGMGTDKVDMIIKNGKEEIVREVQAKSSLTAEGSMIALSKSKYGEMQRVAPIEQSEEIKEKINSRIENDTPKAEDYIQTERNFSEGMQHEGVGSEGTTHQESVNATDQTVADGMSFEFKQDATLSDMYQSGFYGGAIGGALGTGIASFLEYRAYSRGELSFGAATRKVAVSGAKCFATGYTVTALSKGIKHSTSEFLGKGLVDLTQSTAPVAVSAAIVNSTKSIYKYLKGDIDTEQLLDEISHTAISSTAVFYYGALGQTVIPIPVVGSLVGAGVGLMVANVLHQSGLIALGDCREVKIAKKKRREIEVMCLMAIAEIEKNRTELIAIMDKHFSDRNNELLQSFSILDEALSEWSLDKYMMGLTKINECFGKTLHLNDVRKFDEFMKSDEKFVL